MKYNDFTMIDYSKNGRNDSKFYNMKNLSANYKIATYFLNYFANPEIMHLINKGCELDPCIFSNNLPNSIYKRIDIMAEYVIDEKQHILSINLLLILNQ